MDEIDLRKESLDAMAPREAFEFVSIYMAGRLAGLYEDVIADGQWDRTYLALLYWLADQKKRTVPTALRDWGQAGDPSGS